MLCVTSFPVFPTISVYPCSAQVGNEFGARLVALGLSDSPPDLQARGQKKVKIKTRENRIVHNARAIISLFLSFHHSSSCCRLKGPPLHRHPAGRTARTTPWTVPISFYRVVFTSCSTFLTIFKLTQEFRFLLANQQPIMTAFHSTTL